MKIIPRLNLNKHPDEVVNGSIIDGTNLIVSKDNAVIQSEPILNISNATVKLNALLGDNSKYKIIYCISCNKELVIFSQDVSNSSIINIYRYSENYDEVKYSTTIDYSGGDIIGDFTYNHDELIITFSEYFNDNSKKIPLKVINLGTFENGVTAVNSNQLTNKLYHPICPEVKIPIVKTEYIFGNAYKGWYYIFIRYKISDNTYTQWFNTNACCFVDNFESNQFLNYWVSKDNVAGEQNNKTTQTIASIKLSDNKDLSIVSFKCIIENIDTNYDNYQLGFICVSKSYTRAYKTYDIAIIENSDNIEFEFKNVSIEEYNINELILSYYNYFNVKSLITNKGRLYIGNYFESNDDELIDLLKNISITFNWNENSTDINENYDNIIRDISIALTYNGSGALENTRSKSVKGYRWLDNNFIYYKGTTCLGYLENWQTIENVPVDVKYYEDDDVLTIKYFNGTELTTIDVKASELIIAPFISWSYNEKRYTGRVFKVVNGELEGIGVPGGNWEGANDNYTYIQIVRVNGIIPEDYYGHSFIIAKDDLKVVNSNYEMIYEETISENAVQISINSLKTNGFSPEQPYNFFIHFIDKYGRCTNGYNLSYFNISKLSEYYTNNIGNILIYCPNNDNNIFYTASIQLSSIPDGYVGYFVSYEKLEKRVKYRAFNEANEDNNPNNINIYSDEFNFSDSLDFDFDSIEFIESTNTGQEQVGDTHYINEYFIKNNSIGSYIINSKQLFVADSYNNISKSTRIALVLENSTNTIISSGICKLYNSSYTNYYNKENKILIPCSPISYTNSVSLNAKTNFMSFHHAIIFKDDMYYNDALKVWQKQGETGAIISPINNIYWIDNAEVLWESLQFNNSPVVTFFPITGLDTTDESKKSFRVGNIVECKNTIDLYQMKYNNSGESAPKTYSWYNKNVTNIYYFPKTIRRSNIIQDESQNIAWRNFEIENYKIISENKGNIIKLISIGHYFIVHTQHSMFLFNATDTINSKENGIQLASIDIWDIDYKEVITSNLGFAGIQKEYNGITGEFGYIFYDSDAHRIYKYDNNQINYIDEDIINFIYKLSNYDVYLFDDKLRNRILFRFFKDGVDDIVLSYNYNTNTFISRHLYDFYRGWSTKEHTYIIGKYLDENNYNIINEYSDNLYNDVTINIMINTDFYNMKYIEFITYNLSKVVEQMLSLHLPVEGLAKYYAGDYIRIYTSNCDTGDLDITFTNPENTINFPTDYTKPYWRFGNWHFNAIRDKLAQYIQGNVIAENSSRIYGNWFVIKFICLGQQAIEFESIDAKLINGEK